MQDHCAIVSDMQTNDLPNLEDIKDEDLHIGMEFIWTYHGNHHIKVTALTPTTILYTDPRSGLEQGINR